MIKKIINQFMTATAGKLGYAITPLWTMPNKHLAELIRSIIDRYKISCVLDVGANRGQFAEFLRSEVGFSGRIISFEPIANNANYLSMKSAEDPLWSICPFALGRKAGFATLNIMEQDVFSSFLRPTTREVDLFAMSNRIKNTQEVTIRTLDEALSELKLDISVVPTFLKLDTQGFDLEVLAGSISSLPFIKAIQSEISATPIYENMPDIFASLTEFRNQQFSLAGMFPVSRDEMLCAIEFDAIFINKRKTVGVHP